MQLLAKMVVQKHVDIKIEISQTGSILCKLLREDLMRREYFEDVSFPNN